MHGPSVRAVGLELRSIEFREQRMDFRELEHAADTDRSVTRELLQPILEGSLAAAAKARVAHALDHVAEQFRTAFRPEHRRRTLEQKCGWPERLDLEAHRTYFSDSGMNLRCASGVQLDRNRREHRLRANPAG